MTLKRALILDTETTGLDPAVDQVVEIACILFDLENGVPLTAWSSLVRAESNAAESINRIPVAALRVAPEPDRVFASASSYVKVADVILAHRADFDRGFVGSRLPERPWVCTKFHVEWPGVRNGEHLVHLALDLGLGVSNAHRAMTDCDTLARCLTRVRELGHPLVPLLERAMRPRVKLAAVVSYDDREKAKTAGFAWCGKTKTWWRDMPPEDAAALPFPTRPAAAGVGA